MKFIQGQIYKFQYTESNVVRQGVIYSQIKDTEINGDYEYIGRKGSRFYFFDNDSGKDLLLSKGEAIKYLVNKD